jgi:hypothetical protein
MDIAQAGKVAYNACVEQQKGKYADGTPMPHWENLPQPEQLKWGQVAIAVFNHLKSQGWTLPPRQG